MSVSLAIIGTAGRPGDHERLALKPAEYLAKMLDAARAVIRLTGATKLVSGGAAWADHCAVLLYLEQREKLSLALRLPAPWEIPSDSPAERLYFDNGGPWGEKNPGGISNRYHQQFLQLLDEARPGWSPFLDFGEIADDPRVTISVGNGFFDRNDVVGEESDFALAMTFGHGPLLKDGGTSRTMRTFLKHHSAEQAYHLDLNSMRLCKKAQVPRK